jgi:phospholipase/carboxylesterase
MLGMADEIDAEAAYLAPQAAQREWYPQSFLAPVEANEPGRSSGLQAIRDALAAVNEAGISTDRTLVVGFSQGGCLATEYLARNPRRYGGLAALSGGLIGETIDPDDYEGDLADTPAFFGCSDVDPHIPKERVHESANVFERLGAAVETRLYEGMGHTVNQDELDYVSRLIGRLSD